MSRANTVSAELILLKTTSSVKTWKVRVEYDLDYYMVLITDAMVTVYRECEMPEGVGVTLSRPETISSIRACALECTRRVRFGET